MKNNFKKTVVKLATQAGLTINNSSNSDLEVYDENFYSRVLKEGSLGLGESYMDGLWDASHLDEAIYKILVAKLDKNIKLNLSLMFDLLLAKLTNKQTKNKAQEVAQKHYDLGNDLFAATLDPMMVYTGAYWKTADTLEQAQIDKLDLVCKKLDLKPGMRILDIGCGWGSFIKFACERYGVSAVGITISKEQAKLARELCAGYPIEIKVQDYREIEGVYDSIVSLGMFEHVGYKNHRLYMKVAREHLKDEGLFLLHTIGRNFSGIAIDPWMNKYIFPNAVLPSPSQITKATEGLLVMEDWHNFGADYDKTLMAWLENFTNNWHKIRDKYDERFFKMWKYYLCCCAASFRVRDMHLWQIVFSKNGVPGGYKSIR